MYNQILLQHLLKKNSIQSEIEKSKNLIAVWVDANITA